MSTVLIVEDSLVERKALTMSLNRGGFEVLTAKSGEEAKEKISTCQPDVIILDVMLPGSSGFEICRQFKADPETNKIPVVFCSSKGTELDKFWGLKQGASAYLTKPFISDELIQVINDLIKSKV
ncbi:MAG: response regulator [Xenococcaceae cyanobacterium MO_167.B52]|nr:response regulator [Xenococcaceae cyanobacterium MO_167.B52]